MNNRMKKNSNGTKRVLIFSTAYFPFVGGAEVAVKELTSRLTEIQFDLITAKMDSQLPSLDRIGQVTVYRVGIGRTVDKFLLPALGTLKALNLHSKDNYDAAWSLMASQASIAATFFKILKPKVKLLLNLQEGDEEIHLARYVRENIFLFKLFIQPWHRLVFKKADYITVISNYLKKRAQASGANCPIEVVPNAVDRKHFSQQFNENELNELKVKLAKKDNEKYLITTSRLVQKNALDDVIKSLAYLPTNIKFLILGVGQDKEKLLRLVKEIKVDRRVLFLGHISQRELPKYLKISDIFIRPSLSEGLGNSFLEAMAAGVPVIGTPVGGIPDFLKDGETGLFCEVRHPESIAAKVLALFENNNLREKIINNAKEMVKKNYDWVLIANKMQNIFNNLISS